MEQNQGTKILGYKDKISPNAGATQKEQLYFSSECFL